MTLQNHTLTNKTLPGTSVIVTCDRVNHASPPEPTPDTTVRSPAPLHVRTRRTYHTPCVANGAAATTPLSSIVSPEIVTLQNHTLTNKTLPGTSVIVTCDRVNHASPPEPTPDTTVRSPAPLHVRTRRTYHTSCVDTLHGKSRHVRSSRVLPCNGATSASNDIFAV